VAKATGQIGGHILKGKGGASHGKGKNKSGRSVLPKFLLGRDNTNMDMHGRRECPRGWHLYSKKGCHAPHAEKDHDQKKK